MAREKLKDLIEAAPDIVEEHWDEIANLTRRHAALRALFRNMLVVAQDKADQLVNISTASEEGREQSDRTKGAIQALQSYVGAACGIMGDAHEEELEAAEEAREEVTGERTTRSRARRKPVTKQLRKRRK